MFGFAWWLSFVVGFLSLSQEIIWVRVLGFAYDTVPVAFAFVLAMYLLGIALGAAFGKRLCEGPRNLYALAGAVLCAAAVLDAAIPGLLSILVLPGDTSFGVPGVLIVASAGLKSTLFPIVHQLGSVATGPRMARSVSRIYFGNILGSALGPLLTGFIALDTLSVDECFALSTAACLVAAAACASKAGTWRLLGLPVGTALLAGAIVFPLSPGDAGVLAALAHKGGTSITHLLTNRNGVIHATVSPFGDFVYGGNVYDGIATVDVAQNGNRLDRIYLLALLHPHPAHVLVIGMSTGAWTRALEGFPGVETIDVVEINPGYVKFMQAYPDLALLMEDKRLRLHIDDGRRWLKRNPDSRFDLIVQNTTYHWRANATDLLSRDFFTEVRQHLHPGGIVTFNSTGSYDVLATAAAVFPYSYLYVNTVYVSDRPLAPVLTRLAGVQRPDGIPFSLDEAAAPASSVVTLLRTARLEPTAAFSSRHHVAGEVITDDNVLTEYRHGRLLGFEFLEPLLPPRETTFTPESH